MKIFLWFAILFLFGCIGCANSGNTGTKGVAVRENNLKESWQRNQISTYEYLSASIDLAHDKSVIRFNRHKALLTRYPKWVPGFHPRPDTKLRNSIAEAYAMGRIGDSEYESLMAQISALLDRWGDQRRILTRERFNLGYPR